MRSVKNNLVSLLIHVLLSIYFIYSFYKYDISATYSTREAALNHLDNIKSTSYVFFAEATLFYIIVGRKFLKNQGTILKNLVSTSLTAIIGILIWLIAQYIDFAVIGTSLLNSGWPQLYNLYNGYSLIFLHAYGIVNPNMFLLFAFLPTIIMSLSTIKKEHSQAN